VVFSPSLKGHSHLQSLMVQSVDPHAVMSAPELPQVSSPSSSLLARRGRQMPTLQCRTAAHGLAEEVATMNDSMSSMRSLRPWERVARVWCAVEDDEKTVWLSRSSLHVLRMRSWWA